MEGSMNIRMSKETKELLNKKAFDLRITPSELARIFITDGLAGHDKNHAQLVSLISELIEKLEDITKLSSGAFAAAAFTMAMNEQNPAERREILKGHIPRMFELGENLKKYIPKN